ncbi:retrovirus-related pol polyprotein from transposon TNT 1-94 [Tanacetum coccineum]
MINDPIYISSSDQPEMVLTNTPFNGSNFYGWNKNVRMTLGAKLKLRFIDGSCPKPSVEDADLQRWIRCDYMVASWILNSMVAELFDAFLYAQATCNLTIASFFNKLKKCWDELQNINGLPTYDCGKIRECTCDVLGKVLLRYSNSKLIEFLMKLNDDYECVRSQILAMDPLPTVNKAYYIVKQIEKQKQVTNHSFEPAAFFANLYNKGANNGRKYNRWSRNDGKNDGKRFCTGCNQEGHTVDQCFEKIGYPNWYKRTSSGRGVDQRLVAVVCQKMMKMFKGKRGDNSVSRDHAGLDKGHRGLRSYDT